MFHSGADNLVFNIKFQTKLQAMAYSPAHHPVYFKYQIIYKPQHVIVENIQNV